jgi:hypothetical protein
MVAGGPGTTYTFDLTQMVQRVVNGEFGSRYTRLALVDTGGSRRQLQGVPLDARGRRALRPRLVITYGGSSTTTSSPTTSASTTSSAPRCG